MVSSGYRLSDIYGFTFREFQTYLKAASRKINLERASQIQAIAIGAQGTSKAIKESLEELLKGINGNN